MDCVELIELFNKVGGILTCDYNKNIAYVANTNLKCDIKPKDYEKFKSLAVEFAFSPYKLEHLKYALNDKNTMNKIINSEIKNKNYYMSNDEYGYKITYIEN